MKKADLSLNTIVIAAIVLIVLVVIILIFTGRIGGFTRGLNDCVNKGGRVEFYVGGTIVGGNQIETPCNSDEALIFTFKSDKNAPLDDQACCLPVGR